jgi:hypothetical protein
MTGPLRAGVLTEDFNAAFPSWESGWLGTNSNLTNYYGVGGGRGNNPDGLWIGETDIIFDSGFAASLTNLSFDVAGYAAAQVQIYDGSGTLLADVPLSLTFGGTSYPGVYAHYSATSSNGIGGFRILGGSVLGNTSIDNVVVDTGGAPGVPEPGSLALLGSGLLFGAGLVRRRRTA